MTYFEKIETQGYYLIAEVGVNYYEIAEEKGITPLEAAKLMAKEAKNAGADAVKYQTYKANNLVRVDSPGSWDKKDIPIETQYELFQLYDHFGEEEYADIFRYCSEIGIDFMSTPFDNESIDYLNGYMEVYKISSSDITNYPAIERIAKKNKPIIMSTGASEIDEIERAISTIKKYNNKKITLLHCILEYPTPYEHANLLKIRALCERYPECIIGYSDHTKPDTNMEVVKTAYLLGARVIEKHFTLDKSIKGKNDHFHSMDTEDLRCVKTGIEFLKRVSGSDKLVCLDSEIKTRNSVRRSAVSMRNISKGEVLTEDMVIYKRPGNGLSPLETETIIGRKANRNIEKDELLDREWFD